MRTVSRWQGALAGALVASAAGLFVGDPAFLVLALPPLAYALYGAVTAPAAPSLSVERTVDEDHSDPGERVTVELTVTNGSDGTVPDLRLVDGVPADVPVVDGSPAAAVALRPGDSATVTYDVRPPRGTHEFGPVTVRTRNLPGTVVETTRLDPDGATTLTCDTLLDEFPLRDRSTPLTGPHSTDTGGDGIAFYGVRDYRPGDPMNRIDWRHLARTGDVATVTYHEERAARVVFVVDDRAAAAVSPPGGGPTTTDLCVYAAARGFLTLTEAGDPVGVTTLTADSAAEWVDPGRDDATAAAASALFERVAGGGVATDGPAVTTPTTSLATDGGDVDDGTALGVDLLTRLAGRTQVVLCTPLVDEVPVTVAETLRADDVPVTVLAPDPTPADATPGQATVALARRARTTALERLGVPVVDWSPDDALGVALADTVAAHERRWGR